LPFTGPFGVLLAVNVGLGLFFGSMQPAVTGFAVQHGVSDLGGVLCSVMSAASLIGVIAYGARRWSRAPERLLTGIAVYLVAATAALLLATNAALLAGALALVGIAIAATLTGWAVDTFGGMAAFGCTVVFVGLMAIAVVVGAQLFTSRSVRA